MKYYLFLILFLLVCEASLAQKRTKVACVGNSITFGYTLADPKMDSYPSQLQRMLGNAYEVGNFGKSGATLLNKGHRPYMQQQEYRKAMEFAGDIAVIHLGINDTDPRDWPYFRDFFVRDYLALIDSFKTANPRCRVIIARMTPIADRHLRFESGTRDWHGEIQSAIETVARYAGVQLVDFHEPLYPYPFMLPDALHPTKEGAGILAKTVYSAITGDFGGLQLPAVYGSNMVLQRDCPLKIHGMANAGDEVTVTIGKQKHIARTGLDGKWSVVLRPLKVGSPYMMTISTVGRKLVYNNILAGEVWLCSGQSNMEFRLNNALTAKADIPEAVNENIRLFDMKGRWATNAVEWDASVLDSLNHLQYYKPAEWKKCSPAVAGNFSAVAYYFGKMLQDSLKVPVGLICNAVGGSPTEAWIDRSSLEHEFPAILRDWTRNDFIQDWVRGRAALNIKKSTDKQQRHPYEPCYLYEAGIRPLEQFPLKGVIWYQGESNAHNKDAHGRLFRLLVDSWRRNWDNADMPFYFVQLSSIDRPSWPWFRYSQLRLMKEISGIGMAVSSDYGDSLDVHPKAKKPIGERLARWALNKTYGKSGIVPSGPLFRSAECRGGAVYIEFDYGEGLRSADGKLLRTFEVAESEGLYEPAVAEVEGNYLKVYNEKIRNPRYVRYGWQPFTRANLVNAAGLPASTFRAELSVPRVCFTDFRQMRGFPSWNKDFSQGVSACFAGIAGGKLLMAGGCNFPGIPAKDGGEKKFYQDIYVADITADSAFHWKKAGRLPCPMAYGVSVSTPEGIICAGGMNKNGALNKVFRLRLKGNSTEMEPLPDLPCLLDNMTGALWGNLLYIAGGNKNGTPCNDLYCLDLDSLSAGWKRLPDFPGTPRIQPVSAVMLDMSGKPSFCLWGGFAASKGNRPASLSVDGYAYSPASGQWKVLPAPINADGDTVSLGGGAAVALSDSLLLCIGGVHKDIFLQALQETIPGYMTHPAEWYRFNQCLLVYNMRHGQWTEIMRTPDTARAGAALVFDGQNCFCINGELKPGIRTPMITRMKTIL
ncbi:cyclically-permuted mutarotase family protein [Bacteroides helcogenes]|uniref:Cyclically-permuted mutarotase family protein n=1 Tax=Bacteroides helcogenes (strain ATCC 35417 / DSM 20613 / JCM 6297 / CCUG 15421 / P 36-108) TaxID=693979 RepID=E6SN70_BACT6|nr:cyclically-permuted mutarotase family protein [Bacteroides helcogenes]ADV44723.1 cyclically-permuted mutarotase family protein [Bacteroides helcogenes P 36-108]